MAIAMQYGSGGYIAQGGGGGGGGGSTGIEMVLVWTNSDPTTNFAAQEIALDLSEYDAIVINVKCSTSLDEYFSALLIKTQPTTMMGGNVGTTAYYYKRQAGFGSAKVQFGDAFRNTTKNNAYAIPYQIYGVKGIT